MKIDKGSYFALFRSKFESYAPVSDSSWLLMESLGRFQSIKKGEVLLRGGDIARDVYFVCSGALRAYVTDQEGDIYNKNIFLEGDFAASTVSLLRGTASNFTLETLEDTLLISLQYQKYREYIFRYDDLKNFYIAYLERNWVVEKEQREISLVMENATDRYMKLLETHPDIESRIQQMHIAAHLGITPTQLSRIRKNLKK